MSWLFLLKPELFFFQLNSCLKYDYCVKKLFCVSSNLSCRYTIEATTLSHRLSTYFPLFRLFVRIRGRMTNALCFYDSLSAESSSASSKPVLNLIVNMNVNHVNTIVSSINSNWNLAYFQKFLIFLWDLSLFK